MHSKTAEIFLSLELLEKILDKISSDLEKFGPSPQNERCENMRAAQICRTTLVLGEWNLLTWSVRQFLSKIAVSFPCFLGFS